VEAELVVPLAYLVEPPDQKIVATFDSKELA
jgi:hypothetical protein